MRSHFTSKCVAMRSQLQGSQSEIPNFGRKKSTKNRDKSRFLGQFRPLLTPGQEPKNDHFWGAKAIILTIKSTKIFYLLTSKKADAPKMRSHFKLRLV